MAMAMAMDLAMAMAMALNKNNYKMKIYYSIDLEENSGALEADTLPELRKDYLQHCEDCKDVLEIEAISKIGFNSEFTLNHAKYAKKWQEAAEEKYQENKLINEDEESDLRSEYYDTQSLNN